MERFGRFYREYGVSIVPFVLTFALVDFLEYVMVSLVLTFGLVSFQIAYRSNTENDKELHVAACKAIFQKLKRAHQNLCAPTAGSPGKRTTVLSYLCGIGKTSV